MIGWKGNKNQRIRLYDTNIASSAILFTTDRDAQIFAVREMINLDIIIAHSREQEFVSQDGKEITVINVSSSTLFTYIPIRFDSIYRSPLDDEGG